MLPRARSVAFRASSTHASRECRSSGCRGHCRRQRFKLLWRACRRLARGLHCCHQLIKVPLRILGRQLHLLSSRRSDDRLRNLWSDALLLHAQLLSNRHCHW